MLNLVGCDLSQVMHPYSLSVNSSSSLEVLYLDNNKLNSSMYRWLCPLTLSGNTFDGKPLDFLNSLSRCKPVALQELDASNRLFTGSLSDEIQQFSFLHSLNLSSNEGAISENIKKSNLDYIDLSYNSLKGVLFSDDMSNDLSQSIQYIDFSSNNSLRDCLWHFKELVVLNLANSNLSGRIPASVKSLIKLEALIPSGTQLQTFEPSRYLGNARLCGLPLTKYSPGDKVLEVTPVVGERKSDGEAIDELQRWFYIGETIGFAMGFWIVVTALLLNRRGRHAFFHFHDCVKDWVYVKVVVFIAKWQSVTIV
nr:leucine-rich repeat domain, L domain-like protein [Tanacetum cinerariifolium]